MEQPFLPQAMDVSNEISRARINVKLSCLISSLASGGDIPSLLLFLGRAQFKKKNITNTQHLSFRKQKFLKSLE